MNGRTSAMLAPMNAEERMRALLDAHATELPAHDVPWVRHLRRQGMRRFMETGFPTPRQEEWKYTDVRRIADMEFVMGASAKVDAKLLKAAEIPDLDVWRMVFVNGLFVAGSSHLSSLPAGVRIESLARLLASEPTLLKPHLKAVEETSGFGALSAAFLRDGACILVEEGVRFEKPIHLLFIAAGEVPSLNPVTNLILAGAGSEFTVVETYVGDETTRGLSLVETHIHLEAGAALTHYRLERQGTHAFHVQSIHCRQQEAARLDSYAVALGASLSRTDIQVHLAGKDGTCALTGLYLTTGRRHVDFHTRIDHRVPDCASEEYYRGVLCDRSRAVFNGKVVVHEGADGTDASQSNGNLLLSRHAEVDTKPELEIYADAVKCAHGATVGQLDLDHLFYLRSRGIEEVSARNMLTYAFADAALRRMKHAPIRRHLEQLVPRMLPQTDSPVVRP